MWWRCNYGHEWQASVLDRTHGRNCPYCSGRYAISGETDLKTTRPDLASEWHPQKNNNLLPEMFKAGSGKKVWWQGKCGHEWQATISNRNAGKGCPYCAGKKILK